MWIDDLLDDKPSEELLDYAISLIGTSIYEEDKKCKLERNVFTYTSADLDKLITQLKNDQVDAIDAGHNYQQGDITNKLKRL